MNLRHATTNSVRAWRRFFPLTTVESVVELFEESLQISPGDATESAGASTSAACLEPNLAFLSIILGYIESHISTAASTSETGTCASPFTRKRALTGGRSSRVTAKRMAVRLASAPSSSPEVPPEAAEAEMAGVEEEGEVAAPSTPSMAPSESTPSPMSLTTAAPANPPVNGLTGTEPTRPAFPTLRFEEAEQLYQRFYAMIVHDPKVASMARVLPEPATPRRPASSPDRALIKAVCDVLCTHMSSSTRQREHFAHAQSIYSLLKYGQLDSFGLAYAVVAACQLLGYSDVHMALSEDHAWVEFGPPGRRETADVSVMPALESAEAAPSPSTALYPPPVRLGHLLHSWLYLNGCPVVCNPLVLSVAAAVTAIQPCGLAKSVRPVVVDPAAAATSASSSLPTGPKRARKRKMSTGTLSNSSDGHSSRSVETISPELVRLKQSLLWMVYRAGLLNHYPLGLTNLADIEEVYPSCGRRAEAGLTTTTSSSPEEEASCALPAIVEVHGGLGEEVASAAANEVDVPLELLRRAVEINRVFFRNQHVYPYIYLANYLRRVGDIPGALRYWAEAARVIGQYNHSSEDAEIYREFLDIATRVMPDIFRQCAVENRAGDASHPNLLESPLCLAYLLAFYDHLCLWEEGSTVPVLHVGWVDKLVASLARFPSATRTQLHLEVTQPAEDESPPGLLPKEKAPRPHPGGAVVAPIATAAAAAVEDGDDVDAKAIAVEAVVKTPEPLSVILPPPTSTVSFQSCSTTGSSVLSMFTNTPLPSLGDAEPAASAPAAAAAATAGPQEVLPRPESPAKQSLHLPGGGGGLSADGVEQEEDLLDVYSLVVDCCTGSKEKVISRLARASQFRLLNPAFLMGDLSAPPFITSEELSDFLMEQPLPGVKVKDEKDHKAPEFLAEAVSATPPAVAEVQAPQEKVEDGEETKLGEAPHPPEAVNGASTAEAEAEGEEGAEGVALQSQHRASSPESSACPSLPSIASTPPVFALPLTPPEAGADLLAASSGLVQVKTPTPPPTPAPAPAPTGVCLHLHSTKMCRIARLLNAPGSLKSSAIKLTLTAQSEVDFGRHNRRRRTLSSTNTATHLPPRWDLPPASEPHGNSPPATE